MINQRLNEAVARKFGYNGPADSEAVDKFLMSKPESINTVRRALNIMKPTTGMAEGGDTETTATTTPVEPDTVPTKTPEELAEEERQRVIALQKTALTGQQNLVANVSSDPSQIVAQPTVATIDPSAEGRTIDPTIGQITTATPQVDPSAIATATTAATPDAVTSETVDAKTAAPEVNMKNRFILGLT